jgi:hypothetical protein
MYVCMYIDVFKLAVTVTCQPKAHDRQLVTK